MKIYINEKIFTTSNFRIRVNGEDCKELEVTQEEYDKFQDASKWETKIIKDKLVFTEKKEKEVKSLEQTEKEVLKDKFEKGTATEEDIKKAIKFLL